MDQKMLDEEKKNTFRIRGKTYVDTRKKFRVSSFGDIYLVYEKGDEKKQYILKKAKKFDTEKHTFKNFEMLEQESDFLVNLEKCPHIIKVEGFEKDEDSAMMLIQYANGGDLYNYIILKNRSGQKITIKDFDNLFRQLIVAVNCFHSLGIYNRDIKPENIVFLDKEQTQLAIIDFGLAIRSDTDTCYKDAGTPACNAPEVNNYSDVMFDCSKADIFSLGKVLEFLFKLLVKDVHSIYYVGIEELIKNMLDENPKTRISLHQAIKAYNSFSTEKINVVINEDEQDDFVLVFKAKKSIKKSKQIKRKSLSKQNKRKSLSKQIKRKSSQKINSKIKKI